MASTPEHLQQPPHPRSDAFERLRDLRASGAPNLKELVPYRITYESWNEASQHQCAGGSSSSSSGVAADGAPESISKIVYFVCDGHSYGSLLKDVCADVHGHDYDDDNEPTSHDDARRYTPQRPATFRLLQRRTLLDAPLTQRGRDEVGDVTAFLRRSH